MERHWRAMDQEDLARDRTALRLAPYAYGLALIVAAVGVRLVLSRLVGDRLGFLLLVPSVLAASAAGGFAPGVAVTLAGAGWGLFRLPSFVFVSGRLLDAVIFILLGVAIAFGGKRLREAQQQAHEQATQLAEREAHLQSILDTVPDAMIVIDETGEIQSFSTAAEALFGWTPAEVVGRNVSCLMPQPDRGAHDGYIARYLRTGEPRIIGVGRTVLCERRDGGAFPAELSVGEVVSGRHRFFTGFLRDLSEREESSRRIQLIQSELLHVSRLSAMGEMAAALAHELNQPLSAVANFLNGGQRLLKSHDPDSPALEPIAKAVEQSLRAGQIIRRLRDFVSRGDSERREEPLAALVDEAVSLAMVGTRSLGVILRVEHFTSAPAVFIDKVQIQQVLLNLIRNALEAMESVERRELMITVGPADKALTRISVIDTGTGLDPSVAERLFQPFVSTKSGQGMGVGLSICRSIVESHGGRIWAEPNPGGGTAFHLTIPRAGPAEAA
ncbi:MAG TPA: PAS domain S-box protein [Caulobacteraceae bacterium]|jgi:two-component system sensor kinase FixL